MQRAEPPNILFLMTDEQRFDAVGYVNPRVHTPNLDALARESVVFSRAYSTNPSCVPARAAIFTGRYPSQCGAPTFITCLPPEETTFQALLREAGYHTAVIGKQHFGRTDIDRGYDYEEINDCHAPTADMTALPPDAAPYLHFLHREGFTSRDQLVAPDTRFTRRWIAEPRLHVDDFVGDRARNWLQNRRPASGPWYLCVSFPGPHQPFDGIGLPEAALYNQTDVNPPIGGPDHLADKPPHFRRQLDRILARNGESGPNHVTESEARRARVAYYANVTLIDRKIGELLADLKATGDYENTMILFGSDHGDFLGDYGTIYKGQFLSEVLMRIPFLIKPAISNFEGRIENGFVSSIDIAPTCLAAARAPLPSSLAGRDLSAAWCNPGAFERPHAVYMEAQHLRGIRTERYKLVHYAGRDYGELYDLEHDPGECRNLWSHPDLAGTRSALRGKLIDALLRLEPRSEEAWNRGAPEI